MLAVQLGKRLGLPVVHLDPLYCEPGWQVPDSEGFLARVTDAIAGAAWVSEGNYRETFQLWLSRVDAVIILARSRWVCPRRVLWRSIFRRGTSRPAGGLPGAGELGPAPIHLALRADDLAAHRRGAD